MSTSPSPRLQEFLRAFEDQFDYVHRTLRRHGVPAADVDDLAQEVFMVMWRRWSEFDQSRALRPWLAGIAFNRSHLRRPRREVPTADVDATDQAPHGEDGLAAARARRFVLAALDRLPDTYRTVLILRDIDGVPMRQIAALQGVPLFTAYTRLRKARRDFAVAIRLHTEAPARRPAMLLAPAALFRALVRVVLLPAAAAAGLLWLSLPPQTVRDEAPVQAAQASLGRDLLAYWRFDDAAGPVVRDVSGQGGDCILRKADPETAWMQGRLGSAINLGAQGWLECPQSDLATGGSGELTVSAWVMIRSLAPRRNRAVVSRQLGRRPEDDFFLGFTNTYLTLNSDSRDVSIRHPPPTDGGWHHLAFTLSHDAATLYLDGQPVGRKRIRNVPRDPVNTQILIGGGSNRPNIVHELFDGAVDEILVHGRALGALEIAALAAGAQPPPAERRIFGQNEPDPRSRPRGSGW